MFLWEDIEVFEVVLDIIGHDGEAPDGPGTRPWGVKRGATNPRPGDKEPRVNPDELLLIWTPDPCSMSGEHIYFSDVCDLVVARTADKGIQLPPDANNYPNEPGVYLDDVCDLQLGVTYYWAIDELIAPDACEAPGPVWSFTITDVYAENPSPEDESTAGPCPTLTWDPGYGAETHEVYFSDNQSLVDACDVSVKHSPTDPCLDAPGQPLTHGDEYFWRVVESDKANYYFICTC